MPYTHNFEGWLLKLDLRGTPNLHTFESHRGGGALKGQSFLVLKEVEFNYHAHCCQLKRSNYSYYEPDFRISVGKREASSYWDVIQQLYDRYLGQPPSSSQHALASKTEEKSRHKRETIPDEDTVNDSLTCLNYTDLNIVLFPPVTETPATEEPTTTAYTVPPTTTLPPCDCGGDSTCINCLHQECLNIVFNCDPYRYICEGDCSGKRRRRYVAAVEEGTGLCSCEGDQQCEECVNFACDAEFSPNCPMYQSICDCQRRQKRNAMDSSSTGETNNITSDLLPDGWFFHPNSTDLICTNNEIVNITTQMYRPCPDDESPSPIAPSHTASAVPDISPTPTTLQTNIILGPSPLSTVVTAETSTPIMTDSVVTPVPCSSDIVEVFCTLTISLPPPPTTVPPTTTAPMLPPCDCGGDSTCINCLHQECLNIVFDCDPYRYICEGDCSGKRRRRYIAAVEEGARLKRDTPATPLLPDGWFYPNPDNTSLACIPISEIENTTVTTNVMMTTTTPTIESSTTSTVLVSPTGSNVILPVCSPELFPLDGTRLPLKPFPTICSPGEDPFNPCEDLLGEDDVLRSFIWIVIILAFFGNFLVILVFLGYTVIIKRTKVELFVVHFFYFNLAVADFIMGIYLFTIAVQDLRTLGNFSMFDVAWRTQGGCDFAGFCAITSTMVSVYVLLIITVERLYTFSRALQKSHTSKTVAGILMIAGWGFGILMGILPVLTNDVNDYTKTAICLPFDVSSKLALSYVLFLLLFTGIVFMVIAICYVIIFYQVFYRQKGTISSVSDKKRWKTELKVALRMGTLVLTNFICWFPIALLGISAAVGNSLVDNITFAKWVMVFIFPINACLNPILYSVLSKVFRDNLVLTLGKCGVCGGQVSRIRRQRAGFTPSVTSDPHSQVSSEAGLVSDGRRGTIIERFRQFSISSTTNLLGRRNSTMSQVSSEEHYQIDLMRAQRRRSSEYSSASSEDILGVKVNSRRGSAFSGGSIEEMTTFSNPGFRSSSPVGGSIIADGNHKGSPRPRISLGAVPEENENLPSEVPFAPEPSGEGGENPAYLETEIHGAAGTSSNSDEQHACGNETTTNSSQTVNHHKLEAESTIGARTNAEHDSGTHSISSADSVDTGDYFARRTASNDYLHGSQEVATFSIEFD